MLTVTAADSRSIYGPLAAPIAVLLWLYLVAIAVLIGAAVNASFDTVFSTERHGTYLERRVRREQLVDRLVEQRGRQPGRGQVALPERSRSPWWALGQRLLAALAILVGTVLLVYFDRDGYADNNDPTGKVSLVDAIYYTTVTLSTTGYGDIAPFEDRARLINAFVITPPRIAFLVLLIGTTLEVLASQGREQFRVCPLEEKPWDTTSSSSATAPRAAARSRPWSATARTGSRSSSSTRAPSALTDAHADGLAVVTGDATRREVLRRAGVAEADQVIITTDRDDSNVLATLTVRQLNPDVYIVASAREHENAPLMKQSGANSVITSSDAVGRLLGLSSLSPTLGSVMEDLLTYGEGLEVAERDLLVTEVGKQPQSLPDQVIAVVRDEKVYRYFDPTVTQLARGDRLVVVRPAKELPWAPRPGTHNEDLSTDED